MLTVGEGPWRYASPGARHRGNAPPLPVASPPLRKLAHSAGRRPPCRERQRTGLSVRPAAELQSNAPTGRHVTVTAGVSPVTPQTRDTETSLPGCALS